MQILKDIYVIGGGVNGIGLSHYLDSNVYLVDGGDEMILIDAGIGINTTKIIENIKRDDLDESKIKKLFLTHAHLDHAGGAADIKKMLGVEIFISTIEAPYLENGDEEAIGLLKAKRSGVYPEDCRLKAINVDREMQGGEEVALGRYKLKVISTPGHSRGSLSFFLEGHKKRVLFTGDAVFTGGYISLQNLPDSSLTEYEKGIKNLQGLEIDALFPSHYGFTINYGQYHIELALKGLMGGTSTYKNIIKI